MDGEDEEKGGNVGGNASRGLGPLRVWPRRGFLHNVGRVQHVGHGSSVAGISTVIC